MHVSFRICCCVSVCICIDTTLRSIRRESPEMSTRAALYFVVVIIVSIVIIVIIVILVVIVIIVIIVIVVIIVIIVIVVIILGDGDGGW